MDKQTLAMVLIVIAVVLTVANIFVVGGFDVDGFVGPADSEGGAGSDDGNGRVSFEILPPEGGTG